MPAPTTESLQLTPPPSRPAAARPRLTWHLATNQLNLMYLLAAGMLTGPKGFGHKYYADPLATSPGWLPLFPDRIPARAFEQAESEGPHLRRVAAAINLKPLAGPVRVVDDQGRLQERDFPAGLRGDEQLLLVPTPLPANWIEKILYPSKEQRAAMEDEATDYANVPLQTYRAQVNAKLLKGIAGAAWPPTDEAPPDRDAAYHLASAIGAAMALLYALGDRGEAAVDAARLLEAALTPPSEAPPRGEQDPLLQALYLWARGEPQEAAEQISTRMLLEVLDAIVDAKSRADNAGETGDECSADVEQVVLDTLDVQRSRFTEPKRQEALGRLADDLHGIRGLGAHTVSELLERHSRPFSRGLILFFLRARCDELLDFRQPLINDLDLVVAAALFAARSGWMAVPAELRGADGLGAAIMQRMAALEHRLRATGLDLGPPPRRPRALRELLTPTNGTWNKAQREAALALARGMGWQQLLQTRISLGKGEYRLQVDGRGVHVLLEGDVKAVVTEVDQAGLFGLLAESAPPARLAAKVRAPLKA